MSGIPWITAGERVVGKASPLFADVDNRPLRALLSQSGYDPDANPFPGLMGPIFNAKSFGAVGDALDDGSGTDDAGAIQAAIDASVGKGTAVIPPGSYKLLSPLSITSPLTRLVGHGRTLSVLKPRSDTAIIVNDTSLGTHGPMLDSLGVYTTAGVPGKFVIDCPAGSVTLRDIWVSGVDGTKSAWAGAFRLKESNWSVLDNLQVAGSGSDRWVIGTDLYPGVTGGNRGNLTVLGGLLYRCQTAARIAVGASQVINNIAFINTKMQWAGDGLSVGGIGIQAASSRMLTFLGVHLESFDVPIEMTQVFCVGISQCRFVGTLVGGPFSIGVSMKTACNHVTVKNNEFDTGAAAPTGIGVQCDATAHAEIEVAANRFVNVTTEFNDLGTGSARAYHSKSQTSPFFFKDKAKATRWNIFRSNITLGAGNNNNVAQVAGGTWRVTCDAGGSTLTGIANPQDGDRIRLIVVAGGSLTIPHNDTGNSSAVNCLFTRTHASVVVAIDGMVDIEYDGATTRWRVGPVS